MGCVSYGIYFILYDIEESKTFNKRQISNNMICDLAKAYLGYWMTCTVNELPRLPDYMHSKWTKVLKGGKDHCFMFS